MIRLCALALAIGAAATLSWLLPRFDAPLDRFSVALELLETGEAEKAAFLFEDPSWQGVAQYRAERFHNATIAFSIGTDTASLYNLGTAHARLHHWGPARKAYRQVLKRDPDHEDARHNLELIDRAERREKELLEAERRGPGQDGGDPGTEAADSRDSARTEPGGTGGTSGRAAKTRSSISGEGTVPGELGDRRIADGMQAGRTPGRTAQDPSIALPGGGTGVARLLRENRQAAEILLRHIVDDPARVLASRLRAIHRQRHPGETGS